MGSSEHTVLSGFQAKNNWGELTTLTDRCFYLRRYIRSLSDSQIRSSSALHPGGYHDDTSDLFIVNEDGLDDLSNYQDNILHKIDALPTNIKFPSPAWEFIQQSMIAMSREYKIHLQVNEDYIPTVVSRLVELIRADEFLQKHIICFKCRVVFQREIPDFDRAVIVIYLALLEKRREARNMCCNVLTRLKEGLAEYQGYANGYVPIYNYPVSDLMSFIQIGTDTKFKLKRILGEVRFNRLFPAKFYQALLLDEKLEYYFKGGVGEEED
ncbi:MAG: hypothetical protein NTZ49_05725 [Candidatus Parcubacteria bacterium]|nr:hypothetical protein [Candidatus Parcubacteria bacterium]